MCILRRPSTGRKYHLQAPRQLLLLLRQIPKLLLLLLLQTSTSLQHVPYDKHLEAKLPPELLERLAFGAQKLQVREKGCTCQCRCCSFRVGQEHVPSALRFLPIILISREGMRVAGSPRVSAGGA